MTLARVMAKDVGTVTPPELTDRAEIPVLVDTRRDTEVNKSSGSSKARC